VAGTPVRAEVCRSFVLPKDVLPLRPIDVGKRLKK
jgi:hypothetical protein